MTPIAVDSMTKLYLFSFQRSDQLMIHLSSFSTVSAHHSVPQSAQDGLPLFYVQPGSSTPV